MDSDQILIEKFIRDHPSAAIHAIEKLKDEEVAAFIVNFPIELTVQVMNQMLTFKAARCVELIDQQLAVQLLEMMDVPVAELLLRQCSKDFCNNMLSALPAKSAMVLRQKLAHPAGSVGAFMKPMILGFRKEISVEEAITSIRREKEYLSSQIFVVDAQRKLEGIVKMHDMLTQENAVKLSSIMIVDIPKFFVDTDIESVANHPGWFEFHDIPVINNAENLIGTLNIKAIRKNNTEANKDVMNDIIGTSNALGELYRIGLTGFLQSVSK